MSASYNIPVIDKSFQVIELLTENPQGLSMQEIVLKSDTAKTTIYRILLSLTDRGYLLKNPDNGRYYLSKRFLKIGLAALGETNMVEIALPQMRILRDQTGESVMLGIFINDKPVLIEQVLGSEDFIFLLRAGSAFSLHASAPGKVFMAHMDQQERLEILKNHHFKRFTDKTIADCQDFITELNKITKQGFATDIEEELAGVRCIGAPVFNQYSQIVATIWLSGPSARLKTKNFKILTQKVVEAASRISSMLGYEKQ